MPHRLGRCLALMSVALIACGCDKPPPPPVGAGPAPQTASAAQHPPPAPATPQANELPAPVTVPTPAPAARVKILTWNINYGGPGMDAAIIILRDADADLVCLQETNTLWEAALVKGLADLYPYHLFRDSGAGGQGFLSKTPLEIVAWIEPEAAAPRAPQATMKGWFGGWIVAAKTAAGAFQVLNVHLRPPCDAEGRYTFASLTSGGLVHRRELERFTPQLRTDLPTLIVGDFNENDGDRGMQYLKAKAFQDALSQHDALGITWHWQLDGVNLTGRYDHILHSAQFTCVSARVIKKGASDHYPVIAEFTPAAK